MQNIIKSSILNSLITKSKDIVFFNKVHCFWHKDGSNWGDALTPILVKMLSGMDARFCADPCMKKYLVIGSILDSADSKSVIWGSGFIKKDSKVKQNPSRVCAVRGPHTRNRLIQLGCDVPEVYGDPALLLPYFYKPPVFPEYEVGLIPHYIDKGCDLVNRYKNDPSVLIIDVESPTFDFVNMLRKCKLIVSSSLHGLICADSYGIPNIWIQFSNLVEGDGFKFRDYFASVHRKDEFPMLARDCNLSRVTSKCNPCHSKINLMPLIDSCPFISPKIKKSLVPVKLTIN